MPKVQSRALELQNCCHTLFDNEERSIDDARGEALPMLFIVPVKSKGPGFLLDVEVYK